MGAGDIVREKVGAAHEEHRGLWELDGIRFGGLCWKKSRLEDW
jgi:hypothetical protein